MQQVTQAVLFVRESAHLEESIQEMHDILDPILSFSCLLTHSCFFYIFLFLFLVTKLRYCNIARLFLVLFLLSSFAIASTCIFVCNIFTLLSAGKSLCSQKASFARKIQNFLAILLIFYKKKSESTSHFRC